MVEIGTFQGQSLHELVKHLIQDMEERLLSKSKIERLFFFNLNIGKDGRMEFP